MKNIIIETINKMIESSYGYYGDYNDGYYECLEDFIINYKETNEIPSDIEFSDMEKWVINIINIFDELKQNNIKSMDFLNPENIGFRNDTMVYYDIGFDRNEEKKIFDKEAIEIIESDATHKLMNVSNVILKHLKIDNAEYIGGGNFGVAFKINDKIIKITEDLSEIKNAKILIGKNSKFLAKYYETKYFKYKDFKIGYIVLEHLDTNHDKVKYIYAKISSILYDYLQQKRDH